MFFLEQQIHKVNSQEIIGKISASFLRGTALATLVSTARNKICKKQWVNQKKKGRLFVFLFEAVTPFLFATATWPRFVLSAALWGFFISFLVCCEPKMQLKICIAAECTFVWCACGCVCVCKSVWQVNYPVAKLNSHKRSANIVLMHWCIKHTQRTPTKLLLGSQGGGSNCKTDNFRNYKT